MWYFLVNVGTLPPGLSGIYSVVTKLKPPGTLVLLDAFQNTDCLHSGKVDILKINAEEARILAECSDETSLLDVGLLIHNLYKLKILAITNGPAEALLIESCTDTRSFSVSRFTLPDLHGIIKDITGNSESPVSSSVSLPEVTGTLPNFDANQKPLLNPLGAGDACSAVFLLEYLDTHNAPTSYLQGLAAASASCLVIDYTSHFDLSIQKAIAAEIQVDTVILTKEVEFSRLAITDEL